MSGPKSGAYVVVSAEERERRALRAARDRFDRVRAQFDDVMVSLSAYEPDVDPAVEEPKGDSRRVEASAVSLESRIEALKSRLSDHRVAAAIAAIPKITISLPPQSTSGVSEHTDHRRTGQDASNAGGRSAPALKAQELVAAMVELTGQAPTREVLRKLANVRDSTSPAQQRLALEDLRYSVQQVRDRHKKQARAARQRADVLAALDGSTGLAARRMFDAVSSISPGQPVPVTLAEAQALASDDSMDQDAEFVQTTVVGVLQDMGYEVGEPMSVMVAQKGVLMELPGHPDHVARLRSQQGQLQFNVVRVGGDVDDRVGDASAETEACTVFTQVRDGLADAGVDWVARRQDAPGQTPVARSEGRPKGVAKRSKGREERRRRSEEERRRRGAVVREMSHDD